MELHYCQQTLRCAHAPPGALPLYVGGVARGGRAYRDRAGVLGIQVSHGTAHGHKRLVTTTCGGANDPGFAPPV
ncbi:MAG: hypothetical protein ACUVSM_05435 [Armatimonadota bacterium]